MSDSILPSGCSASCVKDEASSRSTRRVAIGTPRGGDGGFNARWPWHLDPATISFAETTIEAFQTAVSAIEDDLDYWIEFGQVCIEGSRRSA